MSKLNLHALLEDALSNPERPEEVPDGIHCKASINFLGKLPVPIHRLLILLQSIAINCEDLFTEKASLGSDDAFEVDVEMATLWDHHSCIKDLTMSLSRDMITDDNSAYSPQTMDIIISEAISELNLTELYSESCVKEDTVYNADIIPFDKNNPPTTH